LRNESSNDKETEKDPDNHGDGDDVQAKLFTGADAKRHKLQLEKGNASGSTWWWWVGGRRSPHHLLAADEDAGGEEGKGPELGHFLILTYFLNLF
jgi:hypothetical protein